MQNHAYSFLLQEVCFLNTKITMMKFSFKKPAYTEWYNLKNQKTIFPKSTIGIYLKNVYALRQAFKLETS